MPVFEPFECTAFDGLMLRGRKYGWNNDDRTPVLCVSGQHRNIWEFHELALHLSSPENGARRVLCMDHRGRGNSDHDRNWQNYRLNIETDDVINAMLAAGLHKAFIIGSSTGGLIGMILAAARPGLIAGVVLNDIGPEMDGPGMVRIKNFIETSKDPASWQEAADLLKQTGKRFFPNYSDEDWMRKARQLFGESENRLVRLFDPNFAKTMRAFDLDIPLPEYWQQFNGLTPFPMLLIHGQNSDLLSSECVNQMQKLHKGMQYISIENEGHVPDLDNASLQKTISAFLDQADTSGQH